MSTSPDQPRPSRAIPAKLVSPPIDASDALDNIEYGSRGALLVAGIFVGLLFIGWLAFYFLLFLPRGSVG
jgi:hypothetical protein